MPGARLPAHRGRGRARRERRAAGPNERCLVDAADLIHSLVGFTLTVKVLAMTIKRYAQPREVDAPACQERAAFHLSRSDVKRVAFRGRLRAPKTAEPCSLSAASFCQNCGV